MDDQALLSLVQERGYHLLPHAHRDSPGFGGVLVAVRERPAGRHFEPETIQLRLRDAGGLPRSRTLTGSSPISGAERICPGHITLRDRSGHVVEFLTFGGALEEVAASNVKLFLLRSPAPILELASGQDPVSDQFAAETEALLAEADAILGPDDEHFLHRLAEVDPTDLYIAVVGTILDRCRSSEYLAEVYADLCDVLAHDKRWLASQGLWPDSPPRIGDLLAPPSR